MDAILGIDIGGSGIKAAPVNPDTGELLAPRHRIDTPDPAKPADVIEVLQELQAHFDWDGPVGVTFPGVVQHGHVLTSENLSKDWIGADAATMMTSALGSTVTVLNDADAAGIAEMRFNSAAPLGGTVILVTLGTGIGTAVFVDGRLVPNTELGHIEIGGDDA